MQRETTEKTERAKFLTFNDDNVANLLRLINQIKSSENKDKTRLISAKALQNNAGLTIHASTIGRMLSGKSKINEENFRKLSSYMFDNNLIIEDLAKNFDDENSHDLFYNLCSFFDIKHETRENTAKSTSGNYLIWRPSSTRVNHYVLGFIQFSMTPGLHSLSTTETHVDEYKDSVGGGIEISEKYQGYFIKKSEFLASISTDEAQRNIRVMMITGAYRHSNKIDFMKGVVMETVLSRVCLTPVFLERTTATLKEIKKDLGVFPLEKVGDKIPQRVIDHLKDFQINDLLFRF